MFAGIAFGKVRTAAFELKASPGAFLEIFDFKTTMISLSPVDLRVSRIAEKATAHSLCDKILIASRPNFGREVAFQLLRQSQINTSGQTSIPSFGTNAKPVTGTFSTTETKLIICSGRHCGVRGKNPDLRLFMPQLSLIRVAKRA